MKTASTWRRRLQSLFLASVAVNAAVAIVVLASGDFGRTEGKILATSLLVSATMMVVIANGWARAGGAPRPVPEAGATTFVVGAVLLDGLMWAELDTEVGIKAVGSLLTVGVAATLAAMLSVPTLDPRHRWVEQSAMLAIALLGATVVAVIWWEPDAGWVGRLLGIESVVVAALAIALPTLARFSSPPAGDGRLEIRFCPHCGARLEVAAAPRRTAACASCGLRFAVDVSGPPVGADRVTSMVAGGETGSAPRAGAPDGPLGGDQFEGGDR